MESEISNKKRNKELKEWVISLIIVLIAAFLIRYFVVSTLVVKGISMEPTFYHGNVIVVNKLIYKIGEPKRGDIIICSHNDIDDEMIIKRVIALPGETIDFVPNDSGKYDVLIDGDVIEENYTKEGTGFYGDVQYPYTVPENCYFVMGDNRDNSTDSRWESIGAIEKDNIEGKELIKVWPAW